MSEQQKFKVGDLVRVKYPLNNFNFDNLIIDCVAWELSSDQYKYIDNMAIGIIVSPFRRRLDSESWQVDPTEEFCHIMFDGKVYEILSNFGCLVHCE